METKKNKIAFLFICLNAPYWPYLVPMIKSCKKFFLTDHQVDYFTWSDITPTGVKEFIESKKLPFLEIKNSELSDRTIPRLVTEISSLEKNVGRYNMELAQFFYQEIKHRHGAWFVRNQNETFSVNILTLNKETVDGIVNSALFLIDSVLGGLSKLEEDVTVFPTEPQTWPLPTLMRYHLFLQQEELLKTYDYIFYADADMIVVDKVGDEILGEGLTAAQHPMYAFRNGLQFPLEPNPESTAFVRVPNNYFAGGFQGGTSKSFIDAMHAMRRNIDKDFANNYMARWNDESHWNRYLFDNPPSVVLSPSYVCPDSLIEQYYNPIWGKNYPPKIITLTKPFSITKEGGENAMRWANDFQSFK